MGAYSDMWLSDVACVLPRSISKLLLVAATWF